MKLSVLTPEIIQTGLTTRAVGRVIECHSSLTSTQDRAREAAAKGAPHGTAIFAETQTAGRGRFNRKWESAPGLGVWCSVIVRPTWPVAQDVALTAAAACAMAEVCERPVDLAPRLRWPNDVMVDEKKISGVLVEVPGGTGADRVALVGAGLNWGHRASDFPAAIRGEATSFARETRRVPARAVLARAWLAALEFRLNLIATADFQTLNREWRQRLALDHCRVAYSVGGVEQMGRVDSIDLLRGLSIRWQGQVRVVRPGHVDWLRPF